jgi:hypothetical protein
MSTVPSVKRQASAHLTRATASSRSRLARSPFAVLQDLYHTDLFYRRAVLKNLTPAVNMSPSCPLPWGPSRCPTFLRIHAVLSPLPPFDTFRFSPKYLALCANSTALSKLALESCTFCKSSFQTAVPVKRSMLLVSFLNPYALGKLAQRGRSAQAYRPPGFKTDVAMGGASIERALSDVIQPAYGRSVQRRFRFFLATPPVSRTARILRSCHHRTLQF